MNLVTEYRMWAHWYGILTRYARNMWRV